MEILIAIGLVVVVFWVVGYTSRQICPRCGARAASYRHVRKDGKPDLRFKSNPLDCAKCGPG